MIKNNFSRLVGERLIRLTQIAKETGISRNTLTSIYQRRCKGIEFKTLNTLCKYLDCGIGDIIEYQKE